MSVLAPPKPSIRKSEATEQCNNQHKAFNYLSYAALILISVVMFTPLISKMSALGYDYVAHLSWANEIEQTGKIILPHPLYHILAIIARNLFSTNFTNASTIVVVASIAFLAILNFKILSKHSSRKVAVLFAVSLLLITPLQLYYFLDSHLYFGYVGITLYHSPTMLLLKPLSLIAFCYLLKSADCESRNRLLDGAILALALLLSGISKPSFLMIILPAFLTFLFVTRKLKPMLKDPYIYCAFLIPVITVLTLQFFQTYFFQDLSKATGNTESNITILPFETMSYYSNYLLPKFFLSIAFPLMVFSCYAKHALQSNSFIFSGICFVMGAILQYFFAESGYRLYAGNFWWSGQIGSYLLFLFSVVFLLQNFSALTITKIDKIKYSMCLLLFFAHTAFGVFYFKQEYFYMSKFW